MTEQPQSGWTERTHTPLPDNLAAELRAVIVEAAQAAARGDTEAPPADVTKPFVIFNGHLYGHAAVLRAPNVRQVDRDPGGMLEDWITQQSPAALADHIASTDGGRFPDRIDDAITTVMRSAGHTPSYAETAEVIILGVSPGYDDLVLSRTYLYPVGHLCTDFTSDATRCCFPGHPHLVSPERNPRQLHRLERTDPDLAEVVRACQAGHTIGDTLGSLTPQARERLYRKIVHLVTARVAYLSCHAPAPAPTPRLRWLRRHPTPTGAA